MKSNATNTGRKPLSISKIKVARARVLLPDLKMLVAPGFFEPYSLGSSSFKILENIIELFKEPKK